MIHCVLFCIDNFDEIKKAFDEECAFYHIDSIEELLSFEEDIDLVCWNADILAERYLESNLDSWVNVRYSKKVCEAANIAVGKDTRYENYMLQQGNDDFIVLPCNIETLQIRMKNAIARSQYFKSAREQSVNTFENKNREIEALISNNDSGVILLSVQDGEAVPLRYSERFCELCGYTEEELFDLYNKYGFNALVNEQDREYIEQLELDLINSHKEVSAIFRIEARNGSDIWVEASGNYAVEIEGVETFYLSFKRAEELKALQHKVQEKEKFLESVLSFAKVDYCEYYYDKDECKMLGHTGLYGGEETVYQNYSEFIKTTPAFFNEDRHKYIGMINELRNGAKSAECEIRRLDHESGKYLWTRQRGFTVYKDNKPYKAIGVAILIDRFRKMQEQFSIAMEQNGISAWIVDVQSRLISWLYCVDKALNFDIDFSSVNAIIDFAVNKARVYPDDIDNFCHMFQRVWDGEKNVVTRVRLWSQKHNNYIWYQFIITLIEEVNGMPITAIATVKDITAEKAIERQFQEMLDSKDDLDSSTTAYFCINLTTEKLEEVVSSISALNVDIALLPVDFAKCAHLALDNISLSDEELNDFSLDSLRKFYSEGKRNITKSYWRTMRDTGERMWFQTDCRFMERHDTGELIAFFFNRDFTHKHVVDGLLDDLYQNSYERSAVVFLENRKMKPIKETTATYNHDWEDGDYDYCVINYCRHNIPEDEQDKMINAMLLETVVSKLEKDDSYTVQYDIVDDNGELHRKESHFSYIDRTNGVILIARSDIALYEKFRYASEYDELTGLFNRSKFYLETRKMLDAYPDIQFAFVQLDIARFKLYNSDFGEIEGNNLLIYVAEIIKDIVKSYDVCTFGRQNADKFCLCIPYEKDVFYKKLKYANEKLHQYRADYLLRFKMGVSIIKEPSKSLEEINAKAAIAAEKCSRDINFIYEVYDEEEEKLQRMETEVTNDMHTALMEKQFSVFLQPKVDVGDEKPCGAEALVRWMHPKKGMISPGVFIPVFEKNGFIADLDYYMWEQVCILIRKWLDNGFNIKPVSVNVSRISLYNPNLVHKLENLINKYNIPAELLHLEITESAYMTNPSMMLEIINNLHKAGFIILMDDFGSGYSSLNTLKDFPIDILKIDMQFLPKNNLAERSMIIVSSVIDMAKKLGIKVVMEGVETEEQHDFLKDVGCDYIQGYYYARPMQVSEYEKLYMME